MRYTWLWAALLLCVGWVFAGACDPKPPGEQPAVQEKQVGSEPGGENAVPGVEPGAEVRAEVRPEPRPGEPPVGRPDAADASAPKEDAPQEPRTNPEPPPTRDASGPERQVPPEPKAEGKPPVATTITLRAQKVSGTTGNLLVSNGVPFAQGVLTSLSALRLVDKGKEVAIFAKILARWKDGSVRSALLQFQRPAANFPASLSLEVGPGRSVADRKETPVTWTLPQAVAMPDAKYLCKSMVGGPLIPLGQDARFADYDKNATTFYEQLKGDKDWGNDARRDGYYSTTLTWYTLFLRSGKLDHYRWARREAVHYREDQIVKTGSRAGTMNSRSEPRYLYLRAMELDYLLNGDPKTRQTADLMAKYLRGLHPATWYHYRKSDTRFWTERRSAFPLLGLVVHARWTGDAASAKMAKDIFESLLKTQAEWPDGGWLHSLYAHDSSECSTRSAYGGSPFMTGLLFEGLIEYYRWSGDKRVISSIKKATDWLWTKGWKNTGFLYMIGCGSRYTTAVPDLNLLIAHGFAFIYWANGKTKQASDRAYAAFNQGVKNAYLKTRKHYNQNYRSSAAFLWYITQ